MAHKPAHRKAPVRRSTSAFAAAPVKPAPRRPTAPPVWLDDVPFNRWVDGINANIAMFARVKRPLFIAGSVDLFAVYLRNLPKEARQHHTCNECRRFINTFGRLLIIDDNGEVASAIWHESDAPAFYRKAAIAMREAVLDAGVAAPFYSDAAQWGNRRTGTWTHFAVTPPAFYITKHPIKDGFQLAAEKIEDYKNVARALEEFDRKTLDTAVALLERDDLYRSEKVLAPATWLRDLAASVQQPRFAARLWLAVAKAPAGFCHPRSSMIGSLLEDLKTKSYESARAAFAAKMHPLRYMRPTAAPSEQTIDRAETLVEKLGIATALARRIAHPSDIPESVKLWAPRAPKQSDGVFASLRDPSPAATVTAKGVAMTWAKFERDILPRAIGIDAYVPSQGNYTVVCTAVDPDAAPLMRWDDPLVRNPFNWYVWHGGSTATQHCMRPGSYVPVTMITDRPCHWGKATGYGFPPSRLFFLKGAGETRSSGSALFPECIRPELHEVRSVIERYSKTHNLACTFNAAVALPVADGLSLEIRVTTADGVRQTITLDRME